MHLDSEMRLADLKETPEARGDEENLSRTWCLHVYRPRSAVRPATPPAAATSSAGQQGTSTSASPV
jgi:hypothetical protein